MPGKATDKAAAQSSAEPLNLSDLTSLKMDPSPAPKAGQWYWSPSQRQMILSHRRYQKGNPAIPRRLPYFRCGAVIIDDNHACVAQLPMLSSSALWNRADGRSRSQQMPMNHSSQQSGCPNCAHRIQRLPRSLGRGMIWIYRHTLSPLIGYHCRHLPTCSVYGDEAIGRFGLWGGGWMTLARLLRCQPWGTSGIDNVPLEKPPGARWYLPWRFGALARRQFDVTRSGSRNGGPNERIDCPPSFGRKSCAGKSGLSITIPAMSICSPSSPCSSSWWQPASF